MLGQTDREPLDRGGQAVAHGQEHLGTTAVGGSPDQMMAIIRSDIERWKNIAEKAQVKIE